MNTKQIAEEAWDKLCNNAQTKNRRDVGIAIIQAAIEKATREKDFLLKTWQDNYKTLLESRASAKEKVRHRTEEKTRIEIEM